MARFKELRIQKGLTQEELITQFNDRYGKRYGASSISMFENDKRIPETQSLMDFADFFNVSVDYLLGRTDEPGGTAGSAGVAKEEPPTPETDDISSIFDDRDIRALARKNLDGKSPEEIAKKKERLKKMLEFMFDD